MELVISLLPDFLLPLLVPGVLRAEDVLDLVDDLEVAVAAPLLGLPHPLHAGGRRRCRQGDGGQQLRLRRRFGAGAADPAGALPLDGVCQGGEGPVRCGRASNAAGGGRDIGGRGGGPQQQCARGSGQYGGHCSPRQVSNSSRDNGDALRSNLGLNQSTSA